MMLNFMRQDCFANVVPKNNHHHLNHVSNSQKGLASCLWRQSWYASSMETVTISKVEYENPIKERIGKNYRDADFGEEIKRKPFKDVGFGVLKNGLGKIGSVSYVAKLRRTSGR